MMPWLEAFHRPASIYQAVHLAREGGRRARFVGGGTELPAWSNRSVRILVDTTRLNLAYIKRRDGGWTIGAAVTLSDIARSPELSALADGTLAQAALASGPVQIRNMATLGGKLAGASPVADIALPLLALDAQVTMRAATGARTVPLATFYHGSRKTVLNGALLTEVSIPAPARGAAWSFQRLGRLENDAAIVNVAIGLSVDKLGICRSVRIAMGGVAPFPVRMASAERFLQSERLDAARMEAACDLVCGEIQPVSDARATAGYRREMSRVVVRRALVDCAARVEA